MWLTLHPFFHQWRRLVRPLGEEKCCLPPKLLLCGQCTFLSHAFINRCTAACDSNRSYVLTAYLYLFVRLLLNACGWLPLCSVKSQILLRWILTTMTSSNDSRRWWTLRPVWTKVMIANQVPCKERYVHSWRYVYTYWRNVVSWPVLVFSRTSVKKTPCLSIPFYSIRRHIYWYVLSSIILF